ncbi:hypothetical protein CBS101457_005019 [Exobasidium rhododendri]|nr:hypothetical protein CBS101457_005019 [Exobasidium rhododendri]
MTTAPYHSLPTFHGEEDDTPPPSNHLQNITTDTSNEEKTMMAFRSVPSSIGFVPAIEGIRGVAILMVLYAHTSHIWTTPFARYAGGSGVSMFFVLSGFLITGILVKTQQHRYGHLGRFYMDRSVRLLPPLVPLFAYISLRCYRSNKPASLIFRWLVRGLFYLENQNTFVPLDFRTENTPIKHFWSLSTEEQFYIVWSLSSPLVTRIKTIRYRTITMLSLVTIFCWTAWHAAVSEGRAFGGMDPYEGILSNLYKMLLGSTLRLVPLPQSFFTRKARVTAYGGICITSLLAYLAHNIGSQYWGSGLISIFSALLLVSSLDEGDWFLELPLFRFFGQISYALYMWHFVIQRLDGTAFNRGNGLYSVAVAMCISMFSTFYYEEPIRARYASWKKKRTVASSTTTSEA